MEERLQKILARAGYGSRRACEDYIVEKRVTVNGNVAVLGEKADPAVDKIFVDGQPIKIEEERVYIALHKPRNVISAVTSPDPRQTVRDLVDLPGQLYPVGRLDADSEGLILLTNDGELANRLTHPRFGHEKEYRVLVATRPDDEQLSAWRRGIILEDGYHTRPVRVSVEGFSGKGTWLRVIMKEGRKRQIRETGARLGLPVVKIIRVRIGNLTLGNIRPREWRYLTPEEVADLSGKASKSTSASRSHKSKSETNSPHAGKRSPQKRTPSSKYSKKPKSSSKAGSSSVKSRTDKLNKP